MAWSYWHNDMLSTLSAQIKVTTSNIFLFNENLTAKLIKKISPDNCHLREVFGVNGAYGRHYNFLKAILVIWNRVFRPAARYTFKIDLDQVFDPNSNSKVQQNCLSASP